MNDTSARNVWFKAVILPHEASLRAWLRRIVSSDVDVDDVVSEALIRAYQAEEFERVDRGRAFLFTIARHHLVDLARRKAVVSFDFVANLESVESPDSAASPETIVVARDELRLLQKVIESLPGRCREVFVLRRVDEMSMVAIADRLKLSVSTVEKHLSKAVELVTRRMAEAEQVPEIVGTATRERRQAREDR